MCSLPVMAGVESKTLCERAPYDTESDSDDEKEASATASATATACAITTASKTLCELDPYDTELDSDDEKEASATAPATHLPKKRSSESSTDSSPPTKYPKQSAEKIHFCETCDRSFCRLNALTKHMLTHSRETSPTACLTCGLECFSKSHLVRHTRVHTGEKPFVCTTCNKRFAHMGALNVHYRVHTGVKAFACTICDQRFSLKSSIAPHMKLHSGEKQHVCEVCCMSFSTAGVLKSHYAVHKPPQHGCAGCDKVFCQKWTLVNHMKKHHRGMGYPIG
jgi:uncharacterized Zn-finger protein